MTHELEHKIKGLKRQQDEHERLLTRKISRINEAIQALQDRVEGLEHRVLELESDG